MNERFSKKALRLLCGMLAFVMLMGYLPNLSAFATEPTGDPPTASEPEPEPNEPEEPVEETPGDAGQETPGETEETPPQDPELPPETPQDPELPPETPQDPVTPPVTPPEQTPPAEPTQTPEGGEPTPAPSASAQPDASSGPGATAQPDATAQPSGSPQPSATPAPGLMRAPGMMAAPAVGGTREVKVTIHYEDMEGNQIHPDEVRTIEVEEGKDYYAEETVPMLEGYTAVSSLLKISFSSTAEEAECYLVYEPSLSGPARYAVRHLLQSMDDLEVWEEAATEFFSGQPGEMTSAQPNSYPGYEAGAVDQQEIKEDSSTLIEIKYWRRQYKLVWDGGGEIGQIESDWLHYGQPIPLQPDPVLEGYIFAGWQNMPAGGRMPAEDLTLTAQWVAEDAAPLPWKLTVHYYKEGTAERLIGDAVIPVYNADKREVRPAEISGYEPVNGTAGVFVTRGNPAETQVEHIVYYRELPRPGYIVRLINGRTGLAIQELAYPGSVAAGQTQTLDPNTLPLPEGYKLKSTEPMSATLMENGDTVFAVTVDPVLVPYVVRSIARRADGTREPLGFDTPFTGYYGDTVTISAPRYAGWELAEGQPGSKSLLLGLDSTQNVIEFEYEPQKVTLVIKYFYRSGGQAADPVEQRLAPGAPYSVPSPQIAGYTPDQPEVKGICPEKSIYITVFYEPRKDVQYKVRYLAESLTDPNVYDVPIHAEETYTGTVGEHPEVAVPVIPGYEYTGNVGNIVGMALSRFKELWNSEELGSTAVSSEPIPAEGTLVIELRYSRSPYKVKYEYECPPQNAPSLPFTRTVYTGQAFQPEPAQSLEGYEFSGWTCEDQDVHFNADGSFTMPPHDVTLTGRYLPAGGTLAPYTIRYCLELPSQGSFEQDYKVTYTGTVGLPAPFVPLDKASLGIDASAYVLSEIPVMPELKEGGVDVNVFYLRRTYPVEYRYTDAPKDADGNLLVALPDTQYVRWGLTAAPAHKPAAIPGYEFSGWTCETPGVALDENGRFTMPAQGVTFVGRFIPVVAEKAYKVEYYLETGYPGAYKLDETRTQYFAAAPGTEVSVEPPAIEGYTLAQEHKDLKLSGTVTFDQEGQPELVLRVYYASSRYTVEYRYAENSPKGAGEPPRDYVQYMMGQSVVVKPAAEVPGYTFAGWRDQKGNKVSGTITMPAERLILTGSYVAKTDTPYTVRYFLMDAQGSYPNPQGDRQMYENGVTGASINLDEFISEGMPPEGFVLDRCTMTDSEHPDQTPIEQSGVQIAGDGKTIVNIYYARRSYTLTYQRSIEGGAVTFAPQTVPVRYGAPVPRKEQPEVIPGYVFTGWQGEPNVMPAEDVTVTGLYRADVLRDPTVTPADPSAPGDGIPDIYQAVVSYSAVNGSVSLSSTVVTLYENGVPSAGGVGHLAVSQLPAVTANRGYSIRLASWGPTQPTTATRITGSTSFVVTLGAPAPAAADDDDDDDGPTLAPAPAPVAAPAPAPAAIPVRLPAVVTPAAEPEELEEPETPLAAPATAPRISIQNPGEGEEVELGEEATPLAGPADHRCCILHFILLLAAFVLELLYISRVKQGQRDIFEARARLEEYTAQSR